MSTFRFGLLLVVGLSLTVAGTRSAVNSEATTGVTPEFRHINKLAFGPEGVIFAADAQAVSITALHLDEADGRWGARHAGRARDRSRRSRGCSASTPATC